MFTRTVKSNACSFNNIHPFNYLNATESDLQVFSGVFSGGGGAACFLLLFHLYVGLQVLEYKKIFAEWIMQCQRKVFNFYKLSEFQRDLENGKINEKMFTRIVKSNACSFNNIHPFNYLNATESDLQVFTGVFSGEVGLLASCLFFISMWACKSWNTKNIC